MYRATHRVLRSVGDRMWSLWSVVRRVLGEVPWGNLWRTAVSTYLFALLLWLPLGAFTALDTGGTAALFRPAVVLVAGVVAAIVVWSTTVPWVGDG